MKTTKQAKIMSEQEKAVADYLQEIGVKYQAFPAGKGLNRNGWECDGWLILFTSKNYKNESFEFYTGVGHRVVTDYNKMVYNQSLKTQFDKRQLEVGAIPFAPFSASVLHCLVADSSAIDTSFEYWCSEYGYDTDSISALKTYQTCCDNAKKLKNIFTKEQLTHIVELLQDY